MVAPLVIGALVGGGMGLVKGMADKKKEQRQREVAAETMRWSPWTHMQAGPIQEADVGGSAMQGAMTGAAMGQQVGAGQGAATGSMEGAEPYAGPPMQDQPAYAATTPSGYDPNKGPDYGTWLAMDAQGRGNQQQRQPKPGDPLYMGR